MHTATVSSAAPSTSSKALAIVSWIARVIATAILLQTLFFKFTGAGESVYIFQTVGMEPWGRHASGVAELVASILFFLPGRAALGGILAFGVMAGAIVSHLTVLGIEVQGDGGLLFTLAIVVAVCSAVVVWLHRRTLPLVGSWLR